MEDEVDYSDSPTPSPLRGEPYQEPVANFEAPGPMNEDFAISDTATREEFFTPVEHRFSLQPGEHERPEPASNCTEPSKVHVHSGGRRPTLEDYHSFVLHQASQKLYETKFLRTFLAHALHPNKLDVCLSRAHDSRASIQKYLRSVAQNVDKIARNMIRGTHSRTVQFLAIDENQRTPLWDPQQFDDKLFAGFSPGSTFSVLDALDEPWHRAFERPSVMRHTAPQNSASIRASLFEELDEADQVMKLFDLQVAAHARKKKAKGYDQPGAKARDTPVKPRPNWMAGLGNYAVAKGFTASPSVDGEDNTINCGSRAGTQTGESTYEVVAASDDGDIVVQDFNTAFDDVDVLLQDSHSISVPEDLHDTVTSWGMLVEAHKCWLAEKSTPSLQPHDSSQEVDVSANPTINQDEMNLLLGFIAGNNDVEETRQPAFQSTPTLDSPSGSTQNTVSANGQKQIIGRSKRRQETSAGSANKSSGARSTACSDKPNKRQKTTHKPKGRKNADCAISSSSGPHPSGSKTLEDHQQLPPDAYFEKTHDGEQPVWRCAIKHAMGYYYNAGDRKNCRGCFTSVKLNPNKKIMDFFLPSQTYYIQRAPDIEWTPSKPKTGARLVGHRSHNSIAKDVYWAAIDNGATSDDARQKGREAVEEYLRAQALKAQPKPPPEPTPEPVDLGPHPSGSKTMEHGQELPNTAYFEKLKDEDEFAWRCSVKHALGIYYFSGDVKSCHGCGSRKATMGAEMDFYLPPGTIVRKIGETNWIPRRPYKMTKISKQRKFQFMSHNQICGKKYWVLVDSGVGEEEAKCTAIEETEAQLEAKALATIAKREKLARKRAGRDEVGSDEDEGSEAEREHEQSAVRRGRNRAGVLTLIPTKRKRADDSEDEEDEYESEPDVEGEQGGAIESSDDESSSDSDSE